MNINILLVDDDRTITESLKEILSTLNNSFSTGKLEISLQISIANDINTAIDILRNDNIDILITDLQISPVSQGPIHGGGFEIINFSLSQKITRCIIIYSAYITTEVVKASYPIGINAVIDKVEKIENLLSIVKKAIDEIYDRILMVGNPFKPESGESPNIFGGRAKENLFLEQRINRAILTGNYEHFLVIGEWGVGKTALLSEYKKISQSKGFVSSYINLNLCDIEVDQRSFVFSVLNKIMNGYGFSQEQFSRTITVIESSINHESSIISLMHDFLITLWKDIQNVAGHNQLVLLLLDNFSFSPNIVTFIEILLETLQTESIRQTGLLFGFSISKTNWMKLKSSETHRSIANYFFHKVFLVNLSKDEMIDTIKRTISETGVNLSNSLFDPIYTFTYGHPKKMQVLCYRLFENQLDRNIDENTFSRSLLLAANDIGDAHYNFLVKQLEEDELFILCILASQNESITINELMHILINNNDEHSVKEVRNILNRLYKKNIINKLGSSEYIIEDLLFKFFVNENY